MRINSIHPAGFDPLQREDIIDSTVPVNGPMVPAHSTFIEVGDTGRFPTILSAGDFFIGSIASPSDVDLVAFEVTAGVTYQIDLYGEDTNDGSGTLRDPYLRLLDSSSFNLLIFDGGLAVDDNSGEGNNARFTFIATSTGSILTEVTSADGGIGSYTLLVEDDLPQPAPTVGTLQEMADYLQSGYTGGTEYTFDTSTSNVITVNISGLTAEGQQLALWAMEAWEMVADLDFEVVTSGEMITVDDEENGTFAYLPGTDYNRGSVEINVADSFLNFGTTLGSASFQVYLEQFGRALGLGNLGNYNGSAFYGTASYDEGAVFINDSWQMSVMSAFSQNNTNTDDASYGFVTTAMMVDILAIQDFYGAAGGSSATAGNTVYGENSNLGNYMDDIFAAMVSDAPSTTLDGNPITLTLYDQGGVDTLAFGFFDDGIRLDMRPQQFSDFGSSIGMLGIADGTVIENAILGSGNDTVTGNSANNTISLGIGNDSAEGGAGDDSIDGGIGFDTIRGGADNDTIIGGNGADSLYGDDGNDRIIGGQGFDQLFGGIGNDTLLSGQTADRLFGGDGNDLLRGGTNVGLTVDGLFGETGDDTLFGEGGFDLLDGGTGNDSLNGGAQADNLFGRDGEDTLEGGDGLDRLFGGNDNDLALGGVGNDGLFGEMGNDTLRGDAGNDRFFGGQGNDQIEGGADGDTINGGAGFDTIDGGTGDDVMFGRFNADRFVFEDGHGNDTIGDFNALNNFERIDFSGLSTINNLADLNLGSATHGAATQVGGDVLIDTGGGNSILLSGVSLGDLDGFDFVF